MLLNIKLTSTNNVFMRGHPEKLVCKLAPMRSDVSVRCNTIRYLVTPGCGLVRWAPEVTFGWPTHPTKAWWDPGSAGQ